MTTQTLIASNSVVTVPTNGTDQYIVYLPFISSQSKVITVRDTGGNTTYPIIVSTISGSIYTTGLNSYSINEAFGFLTTTNQSTGLYSVLSASSYPAGTINTVSQTITASTIYATSEFLLQDSTTPSVYYPLTVSSGNLIYNNAPVTQVTSNQYQSTNTSFQDVFYTSSFSADFISTVHMDAITINVSSLVVYSETVCTVVFNLAYVSTKLIDTYTLIADYISANTMSTNTIYADSATASSIQANTITTQNLIITNTSNNFGNINATILSAPVAYISSLASSNVSTAYLTADVAELTFLSTSYIYSQLANYSSINANSFTANSLIVSNSANISTLNTNYISTGAITANTGYASTFTIGSLFADAFSGTLINVSTLTANSFSTGIFSAGAVSFSTLNTNTISTNTITAAVANISTLAVNSLSSASLSIDSILAGAVRTNFVSTGVLNVGVGAISSAVINTMEINTLNAFTGNLSTVNTNVLSTGVLRVPVATFTSLNTGTFITSTITASNLNLNALSTNFVSTSRITTNNISANTSFFAIMNTNVLNVNTVSANTLFVDTISTTAIQGTTITNVSSSNYNYISVGVMSTGRIIASTIDVGILSTGIFNVCTFTMNNLITSSLTLNGTATINNTPTNVWIGLVSSPTTGSNSAIQYSIDNGSNWAAVATGGFKSSTTLPASGYGAAWNGQYWIAVGSNNTSEYTSTIQYSQNGSNFRGILTGGFTGKEGRGVAWNGQYWVAVGESATPENTILTSVDGLNWNNITTGGFSSKGIHVAWNGYTWVAVGIDSSPLGTIRQSTDGLTWTTAASGGFDAINGGRGVAWNGNIWVATGGATSGSNSIQYSYDGSNWSNAFGGFTTYGNSVSWSGELWVAAGDGVASAQSTLRYSYDGINWAGATGTGFAGFVATDVAWNGNYWLASGRANTVGNNVLRSLNGIRWFAAGSGIANTLTVHNLAYSSAITPDIQTANLNIYLQKQPIFTTSTNQILSLASTFVLNNTLYINRVANRIGINTPNPQVELDVNGSVSAIYARFSTINVNDISTSLLVTSNISTTQLVSQVGIFSTLQSFTISTQAAFISTLSVGTINVANFNTISSGTYIGGVVRVSSIVSQTISTVNVTASTLNVNTISSMFTTTDNLVVSGGANISSLNVNSISTGIFTAAFGLFSTVSTTVTNSRIGLFSTMAIGGVLNPAYALNVSGIINATFGVYRNGTALTSDSNVKTNISYADLDICYNTFKRLPLKRFNYIPEYADGRQDKTQLGFIAQDVQEVFPKAVVPIYDDRLQRDVLHLNLHQVHLTHYGATQYLMSTISIQTNTMSTLFSTVEYLQEQMSTITGNNAAI